ncbi:MAG: NTP transferase domain-containing protein, partial [Candidatus Omnitrophica bacterium]|nr:NTP transferase domain-containing protein [Candidatus Omnitrophota bacterium]
MKKNIACIILAAGKGERMKSAMPKVLHEICGRPMLAYVLDLVKELKLSQAIAVINHQHGEVKQFLRPFRVKPVLQKNPLGTADAVKQALPLLNNFKGDCLVLYGDIPLLTKETINKLLDFHQKNNSDATLLTSTLAKPQGYGRILRDKYCGICGIIEEKDANDFQKAIKEVNTGIIVFKKEKLAQALKLIKANNRKKEFYLTDAIGILYKNNSLIESVKVEDISEAMGINSRVELAKANQVMQKRLNEKVMKEGVTLLDPDSTFIGYGAKIGADTTIYPFTVVENDVTIGKRCSIGPFVHLRKGTRLKDDILVGNFVEMVRSTIEEKSLA